MARPVKSKVLRKLSDTCVTVQSSEFNSAVGIASTTFTDSADFYLTGVERLTDVIPARYALVSAGNDGGPANGAAGGGAGGSNLICGCVSDLANGCWCINIGCVGLGRTNGLLCKDSSHYVLSSMGCLGCGGGPPPAPHTAGGGSGGCASPLTCTFTFSDTYFSDTCCVQGCAGNGGQPYFSPFGQRPNPSITGLGGDGGASGFCCSSAINQGLWRPDIYCRGVGRGGYGRDGGPGNPTTTCPGVLHISTPGRKENSL